MGKPLHEAAIQVSKGDCNEGIFFCWTGTGASIIANKHPDLFAALCHDAETARGARIWNHANVLVLSNRTLSQDVAREILDAWFAPYDAHKGLGGVRDLKEIEGFV
jgi:ribose 5-phosphate isomerase B